MINKLKLELQKIINQLNIKTIIVVPDLMHAIPIIGKSKIETLNMHIDILNNLFHCPIWIPTFSYSTVENHYYDINTTKSEIGILNEYFRIHKATWRSPHPIYNFAGTGCMPNIILNDIIYPYDKTSMFHQMNKAGYYLLSYGSRFGTQSRYLLNYIETLANVPYRKDVIVEISIKNKDHIAQHKACYRIMPQGEKPFNGEHYRNDIYNELVDNAIAYPINNNYSYLDIINIHLMVDYFYNKLISQPFYLLNPEYTKWLINNNLI